VRHRTTRRPLRLFDNAPLAEESHSSAILILGYVKLKQQKGKREDEKKIEDDKERKTY
jgi:hypothetical protein